MILQDNPLAAAERAAIDRVRAQDATTRAIAYVEANIPQFPTVGTAGRALTPTVSAMADSAEDLCAAINVPLLRCEEAVVAIAAGKIRHLRYCEVDK